MAKKRQPPRCADLKVSQWHERDRHSVGVETKSGKTVAWWWDDDVPSLVEAGFFKPGRLPRSGVDPKSVLDYVAYQGRCRRT